MFRPVYQPYIWGGDKLRTRLNRNDTPEGIVAESWEVSDRDDGMSVVESGPFEGQTLHEVIAGDPQALLGSRAKADRFPLLIKVLDAAKTLSVQVHPNDQTAIEFGGEAKTEMWYVLEADEGAAVYCGLAEGVTPEAFRKGIEDNALEPMLKKIPVKSGDAIFVPGGRVHAIADGCLLLEVQQNSNTTYRIYDWGRVGADGKSRELHIDQALEVTLWEDKEDALTPAEPMVPLAGLPREKIMESDYFLIEKLALTGSADLPACPESFQVLFVQEGEVTVSGGGVEVSAARGRSVLIPAAATGVSVTGNAKVVRVTLPE
jgi:mannose-6-phosphate isomerase